MKEKNKLRKKGQTEMMGLVVVVILIVFAFLIFLSFQKPKEDMATEFYLKNMPTKVLQTMVTTTTSCYNQDLKTVISDVGSNSVDDNDICTIADQNLIWCFGQNSKEEMEQIVDEILDRSLKDSFINYEFEINRKDGCNILSRTFNRDDRYDGCEKARKIYADTFYITSKQGSLELFLKIC